MLLAQSVLMDDVFSIILLGKVANKQERIIKSFFQQSMKDMSIKSKNDVINSLFKVQIQDMIIKVQQLSEHKRLKKFLVCCPLFIVTGTDKLFLNNQSINRKIRLESQLIVLLSTNIFNSY